MSDKERADRATELLHELYEWQFSPRFVPVEVMQKIDAFLNPPPDYGEPWEIRSDKGIADNNGSLILWDDQIRHRAVACVNACAGMRDPSAEIAALRAAVNQTTTGPT